MIAGPVIASVAALLGDPARANMLTALMDGRALTVSELARVAGVTLQTTSGHLARLEAAKLVIAEKQGRHRYFRLSGSDVGDLLEAMMGLAQRTGSVRTRTGPKDAALRTARVCYDHLAGERGVQLLAGLQRQGIVEGTTSLAVSKGGRQFFGDFGIDVAALERGRRTLCRTCLDWSERRSHLGGALGAAMLNALISQRWVERGDGRALIVTRNGSRAFDTMFSPVSGSPCGQAAAARPFSLKNC